MLPSLSFSARFIPYNGWCEEKYSVGEVRWAVVKYLVRGHTRVRVGGRAAIHSNKSVWFGLSSER